MVNANTKLIALLFAAGLVTGCGGGGGGGSSSGGTNPPVQDVDPGDSQDGDDEGDEDGYGARNWSVVLDGTVIGLTYSTGDIKNEIIIDGLAEYYDHAPVKLFLGKALITEDTGRKVLSPADIQSGAGATNPDFLANLAEVLAAADTDGRLDNGIFISEEASAVVTEDINFDVSYSQFIQDNADLLNSLRAASPNNKSSLLGEGVAKQWMEQLESASNTGFANFEGKYLLFYGDGQYYANIELDHGGHGTFLNYYRVTPKFIGSAEQRAIDLWETDALGSKLFYTKSGFENSCYALNKNAGLVTAICEDQYGVTGPQFIHFLRNLELGTTDAILPEDSLAGDYKRFVRLGSVMSSIPVGPHDVAENRRASDMYLHADGTASYEGFVGTWANEPSISQSAIGITDGESSRILTLDTQIGPFAYRFRELGVDILDPTTNGSEIMVRSNQILYPEDLQGATYTRYHYISGAALVMTTFGATDNSTNEEGVTYRVDNVTGQLMFDGADYDKCSYFGRLGQTMVFGCNSSVDDTVETRFEWWVREPVAVLD